MTLGRLTKLQIHALEVSATLRPPWTLKGGWCVRGLDLAKLGGAVGRSTDQVNDLDRFRIELIDRVLIQANPST